MHPLLVCLFHIMRPLTHHRIPNTVIVPVCEKPLALLCMSFAFCIILVVSYLILGMDNLCITF